MIASIRKHTAAALLVGLGLVTGCAPATSNNKAAQPPRPAIVAHQTSINWMPPSVSRFSSMINEASYRHGVDANLVAIVVLVESGGDPLAVSPAGAVGLMQVMPATARDIATRRGILTHNDLRLYDPAYNIDLGAWYLARQVEAFWTGESNSTVEWAAAAYNGGPGRLAAHLSKRRKLPEETQRYKRWVGGMWRERHAPKSAMYGDWWRSGGGRLVGRASAPPVLLSDAE